MFASTGRMLTGSGAFRELS
uniref:Uncharacterized protein n=1 Tax=Arundo donax TaxID=35708 RepID=A0A0A9AF85_ARUDO